MNTKASLSFVIWKRLQSPWSLIWQVGPERWQVPTGSVPSWCLPLGYTGFKRKKISHSICSHRAYVKRLEVKTRAWRRWWAGTWALGIGTFCSNKSQPQGTWPATITTCYLCRPPLWLPLGDLPWTLKRAGLVPWPTGYALATPDLLENVAIFPHYNSQSAKTASIKVWNPGLPTHARPGLPGERPLPTLPSATCSTAQRWSHYTAKSSDLALLLLDLLALLKRRVSTSNGGSCISTVVQVAEMGRSSASSSSPSTSHLLPLAPLKLVLLPLLVVVMGGPAGSGRSCSRGSSCSGRGCRTLLGVEEPAELEGALPCCSAAMLTQFCSAARALLLLLK